MIVVLMNLDQNRAVIILSLIGVHSYRDLGAVFVIAMETPLMWWLSDLPE